MGRTEEHRNLAKLTAEKTTRACAPKTDLVTAAEDALIALYTAHKIFVEGRSNNSQEYEIDMAAENLRRALATLKPAKAISKELIDSLEPYAWEHTYITSLNGITYQNMVITTANAKELENMHKLADISVIKSVPMYRKDQLMRLL